MHGFRRGFIAIIALLMILLLAFDAPSILAQQRQSDAIRIVTGDSIRAASAFTHAGPHNSLAVSYDGLLWTAPATGESIMNSKSDIAGSKIFHEVKLTSVYVDMGATPVDMKVVAKDTTLPRLE